MRQKDSPSLQFPTDTGAPVPSPSFRTDEGVEGGTSASLPTSRQAPDRPPANAPRSSSPPFLRGTTGEVREEEGDFPRGSRIGIPIPRSHEGRSKGAAPLEEVGNRDPGVRIGDLDEFDADGADSSWDQEPPVSTPDPVCSRALRDRILGEYGALASDKALRRLFAAVVFGSYRCQETGWTLVPYAVLAGIAGKYKQAQSRNFSGKAFLEAAQDRAFPGLEWVNHDKSRGLCRRIRTLGLATSLQQAILRELERPITELDDPVWFVSGKPWRAKPARRKRQRSQKHALARAEYELVKEGQGAVLPFPAEAYDVLNHMNGLHQRMFTTSVRSGLDEALRLAASLPDLRKRASALAALRTIQAHPRPLYQLSARRRSVRVFPATVSLLTVPSDIRRALTRSWVEVDLRSSQLAIAAHQWGAPEVSAMLRDEHYDIWTDVAESFDLDTGSDAWGEVKPAFKEALYSALFGMQMRSVKGRLTRRLARSPLECLGSEAAMRFAALPVVEEMVEYRDVRLNAIQESGGGTDCFGRFIPTSGPDECEDPVSPRSVLAQLAQALELAIVYPAIQFAREKTDAHIVLWQHDGFSLALSDVTKRERHVRQVKAMIDAAAAKRGVPTECVVKWPA